MILHLTLIAALVTSPTSLVLEPIDTPPPPAYKQGLSPAFKTEMGILLPHDLADHIMFRLAFLDRTYPELCSGALKVQADYHTAKAQNFLERERLEWLSQDAENQTQSSTWGVVLSGLIGVLVGGGAVLYLSR